MRRIEYDRRVTRMGKRVLQRRIEYFVELTELQAAYQATHRDHMSSVPEWKTMLLAFDLDFRKTGNIHAEHE